MEGKLNNSLGHTRLVVQNLYRIFRFKIRKSQKILLFSNPSIAGGACGKRVEQGNKKIMPN